MKYIKIIFSLLAVSLLGACEEDERGPLVKDSIAPGSIQEVVVTNMPGGAKIEYQVPNDEDALLVEATYFLDNGREVNAKSSVFKDFVIIEGLREQKPQDVQLKVMDRSNNYSEPITVRISPLTAPVDLLFESLVLVEDFGGVRIKYLNNDAISVELKLYIENESGDMVYAQSAFISDSQRSHFTFRGMLPEKRKFAIKAIDRWNNETSFLSQELIPLEESFIPIEDFKDLVLEGDQSDAYGWVKSNLWNGSLSGSGFHTSQSEPGEIVPPYAEKYHIFSMDLGKTVKLSRMKFWQRQGSWAFRHGNPHLFDVWGTNEIPADGGASLDGWEKLVENGEVIKPSGAPLGTLSAEDEAQAVKGEEFECLAEAPPVRYIRFVNKESWSGQKFLHFMEINFWGQVIE
ncbi:hypothetical protein GCM10007049_01680 [Echinicola pacifica]|uniref:DUF4959 domain-containing protein n=1 Tax=Echinicola pacifica TaxID=346377 RepID=A0A918UJ34_9BACT|nr:DUF5000 domain-containing lipoprotein [Echinicola pacifica]GGZ13536.1 hypothetical protein GCM10007049_01680 [Echinicola pacifica]